jgi:hypothetical protein
VVVAWFQVGLSGGGGRDNVRMRSAVAKVVLSLCARDQTAALIMHCKVCIPRFACRWFARLRGSCVLLEHQQLQLHNHTFVAQVRVAALT